MMERLADYANRHGLSTEWPYFSVDGRAAVTAVQWARLRAKWNHTHGITNVWTEPAVRGAERLKDESAKILHTNQKPLRLIERALLASSDPGDIVWEPFGGLCSVAVAALRNGRHCYSAEINPGYYALAKARIQQEHALLREKRADYAA
jgi:site-specific DNA-methyltransferase (adenine-specific)